MKSLILKGGISSFPVLFFFFLVFSLHAASIDIIRPMTKSYVDESQLSVVVKVNDPKITKIRISDSTGIESYEEVVPKRDVYCESLTLHLGENQVIVTAFAEKDKVYSQSISVFFKSEVHHDFQEEPAGYKEYYFHNDKSEQLCKRCHVMVDKPRKNGEIVENVEDSACYLCHRDMFKDKKGHAPAVNWMCTECHNGKIGEYAEPEKRESRYSAPDPIMDKCFECHKNIKESWFARKSEHGPVRDGRCDRCHNPHGSNEEFFLRKPIWDLCTTCHAEKATGAHVISSFVRDKSHPTKGKPDPARPGRELTCSGCHDPHGSEGIFLLRSKGKTAFSICSRCHKK